MEYRWRSWNNSEMAEGGERKNFLEKRKFKQDDAELQRRRTGEFNSKRWRFIFFPPDNRFAPVRSFVLFVFPDRF